MHLFISYQFRTVLSIFGVYVKQNFTICNCTAHALFAPPSSFNMYVIYAVRTSQHINKYDEQRRRNGIEFM